MPCGLICGNSVAASRCHIVKPCGLFAASSRSLRVSDKLIIWRGVLQDRSQISRHEPETTSTQWMSAPAVQQAHHCGAEDTSNLHCPRGRPNTASNSRSLSISVFRGASPDRMRIRDRHPVAMLRTLVGRRARRALCCTIPSVPRFFGRQAVSGATATFAIIRGPRCARLLDLQRGGSSISDVGVPL